MCKYASTINAPNMGGQYSLARETKTGNLQKEILEILKTDNK